MGVSEELIDSTLLSGIDGIENWIESRHISSKNDRLAFQIGTSNKRDW